MKKNILSVLIVFILLFSFQYTEAQNSNNPKDLYSFGGHVFTGDFPLELGLAILFNAEDPEIAIDTAYIDTLGYYYFYKKNQGNYFVQAGMQIEDPYYGHFSFTFYGDHVTWEDSEIIELTEDNWEYDIHLINQDPEQQINGPGFISGTIENMGLRPFVENVDVILFDENMNPLQHWPSNNLGEFTFRSLDYGQYILYPQVVGLTTHPIYIHITEEQTEFSGIEITIKDGSIASYINEDLIAQESFMIYPNPASSLLNIQYETSKASEFETRIYDLGGRLIYSSPFYSQYGINTVQVNTAQWLNGYYIVELISEGQSAARIQFAVIH